MSVSAHPGQDGNPDFINGEINWKKREMVFQVTILSFHCPTFALPLLLLRSHAPRR
jgi:hypothetical protein